VDSFQERADGFFDERSERRARTSWINYAHSKLLAEDVVREFCLGDAPRIDAVIVTPAGMIGARDTSSWAQLIRLVDARTLPGIGPGGTSFAPVSAVARGIVAAAERGVCGRSYILAGIFMRFRDFATLVADIIDGSALSDFFVIFFFFFLSSFFSPSSCFFSVVKGLSPLNLLGALR
jgi:nucleoside-diphosphate-sugar epimerase